MEFENITPYLCCPAVLAIVSSILIMSLRRGPKKRAEKNGNSPEPQPDTNPQIQDGRDLRSLIFRGENRGTMKSRPNHGNRYRP